MVGDDAPMSEQDSRLAELVEGLTGADRSTSLHAIREHLGDDAHDMLELVARAMVEVDQPPPIRISPALDGLGLPTGEADALSDPEVEPGATV